MSNPKVLYILLFLFLFSASSVNSQSTENCECKIAGKIFDLQTKEPLSFASVQISGTSIGTNSDLDGSFTICDYCEKECDLVFSMVGYKNYQHHHDFHHPDVEIYLAEEQYNLEGVTVEAKRSQSDMRSMSSTKLSSEELKVVQSQSLGDIASQFSGVSTLTTGQNISKPIIHGLHSNRVLVINNGIRHEFQNWGMDHAAEIDPTLSNEIEVVKGASTVRFGPDALGGVILVSPSKVELNSPLKGNVSLLGKSNGQSGEGSVSLEKGFKWFSVGANAAYTKQGDLETPNYLLTNTGKEDKSYSGRFRIHPKPEIEIEGYYSHVEQNLGILLGSTFGNLEDVERALVSDVPMLTDSSFSYEIDQPRQQVSHDLYKLNGKFIGKNQSFDFQYGYQVNERQEFGLRRGEAPTIDLVLKTHSLDLNWFHPEIAGIRGKIGIQGLIQANDNNPGTNTIPFIPNYDQQRLGAYLIESYEWNDNVLEFGLRYDYMDSYIVGREPDNTIYRNDVTFQNFSSTIGFKTQLSDHQTFRSNFGTAWRAPNVAELYRFGQHSFFLEYGLWRYTVDDRFDFIVTTEGILDEEDRPVPPEVGYKWINTYEIKKEGFRAEFTGYVNYVENFIYTTPGGVTRTPRGVFIYYITDQSDALFWGLDASAEWQFNSALSSQLKGSYLWAKQIKKDDFFVEQPPANLQYQLAFQPKIKGLSSFKILADVNYTFEQFQHPRILSFDDFINAFQRDISRFTGEAKNFDILAPPEGYFLVNLSLFATWKQLDFQVGVQNLLDTTYRSYTDRLRYFADGLGRNVQVGVSYQF
ncbi:MAG: TonB-dependent receptor [Bacteroidota bacterium]